MYGIGWMYRMRTYRIAASQYFLFYRNRNDHSGLRGLYGLGTNTFLYSQ